MEDGTNHRAAEDDAQHERQRQQQQEAASGCRSQECARISALQTSQVYDTSNKKKKDDKQQQVRGQMDITEKSKMIETITSGQTSLPPKQVAKSLLVELNKFGKWQKQQQHKPLAVTKSGEVAATAAATVRLIESGGSRSLRQINIVGQLNHSAFRGMLTTCVSVSVIVILLGALLARQPHGAVQAVPLWKSIFAGPSSSSAANYNGQTAATTTSSALKLPFSVSHLMTSSATNPLASLGNSIWPISSSLKSSLSSSSSEGSSGGGGSGGSRTRAARHSEPVNHQRGVTLLGQGDSAATRSGMQLQTGQQAAPPMSQQFHYFWNHDQIDQKTMSDEAQKILADAQRQTDQLALGATPTTTTSGSLDRRDSAGAPIMGGNLSIGASDQMTTSATGDGAGVQVAIPPAIQRQLTSMVLHLQRQAQLSNMVQPRFSAGGPAAAAGFGNLAAASLVAPPAAAAQRRFESVALPASPLLNPMARFWAGAASSQHPVLALPPPSSGPSFATPLFGQQGPAATTHFPAGFAGGPLDAAAAAAASQANQQLMQSRTSLAGVPIYGPFMVAPSMAMSGTPTHSHHLVLPPSAAPSRHQPTSGHKRPSGASSRPQSASSRFTSSLFGRHRKGGWFGGGAGGANSPASGSGHQVAAASGPRPTIALPPPPPAALAAETARSLAASLPPESLALIEAASSQLAGIIMNQMQARSAQQQQQHKMALTAATAAALAARVQQQSQQGAQQADLQADQMQLAASTPAMSQQQQQQQQQVDNQQLFELGNAAVHGLSSLQPPYLLNAAQNLLSGPRGAAIANSLLGQYNQAMSMMQPTQVFELAKLGLPVQLGAYSNDTSGSGLQFGSRLRRRQVVAATPSRSYGHAPVGRPHQAAPYASPALTSARPAANFDEPPPVVTFDRETSEQTTSTTPGGATETDSYDFDSLSGAQRSTLAPTAAPSTTPVMTPEPIGARKARQLHPQLATSRPIKPRNVLLPREPINMRQLFMVQSTPKSPGQQFTPAPSRTGRSLLSTGKRPLVNYHLTPAASELFEITHDESSGQNQLRRLKRSAELKSSSLMYATTTTGWKSIDKTPPSSPPDWAAASAISPWQTHDLKRLEPAGVLKRQAELASAGNATLGQQQQLQVVKLAHRLEDETSRRQDRSFKVKRITASASVVHHSPNQAAHHPISKLAQRTKSANFMPMQTVVGVEATPTFPSSASQMKATTSVLQPHAQPHVRQHSSASSAKQQVEPLGIDPMAASLSESARVVNYFANVENDTPPPATTTTTTTSTTRAPQPVQQMAPAATSSMYQNHQSAAPPVTLAASPPGQLQINVGFAAPKLQRPPADTAVSGQTQGHAHSGISGNSGGGSSVGSSHGSVMAPASFPRAASNSFQQQIPNTKQQRQQQQTQLKSLPVPAGSVDISSAATGNHAYAIQQSGGAGESALVASQDGTSSQRQHFGSQSGSQMLAGQQQQQLSQAVAQAADFNVRQIQLPQLTAAAGTASAHSKQALLDNALVNRNNLINTLFSMSPKSSSSASQQQQQQQQQQQAVSQQSQQQVVNKQQQHQNLNSMDRSPMADQSNQYHDEILAPSGQQQQQQSQNNMGGPPLGLYGAQMLGGGGDQTQSSTGGGGGDQTTSGNNQQQQQQQQFQAYMEMNSGGGQSMAGDQQMTSGGDNPLDSMIQQQQQQANEQQQQLQQGQTINGAQDFGVRNPTTATSSSQQSQQQQQQQQSNDAGLNLSDQTQMELSRFNNHQQQQQLLSASLSSSGQSSSSSSSSGDNSQDQFANSASLQDALDNVTSGGPTAAEGTNQLLSELSQFNAGLAQGAAGTGSDQQQQLLEAQSQSLVNDAATATGSGSGTTTPSDTSSAQLQNSNWPAALQAALASSQQSTRLNMQLEDAMAVRNALLQSQIQQYNQQSQSNLPQSQVDRNFFQSSGSQTTSGADQANQLLLAQSGVDEEAPAGIPSYSNAAQLLAIQAAGQQVSPLAAAGALQLQRQQDAFMSSPSSPYQTNLLSMAGSEKRESGSANKKGKSGGGGGGGGKKGIGGPNKKGDLKHISHHYHFNSLGSPLEDPDSPLLTTSHLDFAGQVAANEQFKADKLARQKRKQKELEQQKQKQQEEQQQQEEEEQEQKPKKKGFLRRFSFKNFFKRFRKDKQKEQPAQQQQSSSSSEDSDGGEQQSGGGGGGESSGSSERAARAA